MLRIIDTHIIQRAPYKNTKKNNTEDTMNTITLPNAEEIALARLSSQELSSMLGTNSVAQKINIVDKRGELHELSIPSSVFDIMVEVLIQLGNGNSVNITPVHAELTTQVGADLLNMSRPTFIKLLDSGAIPYNRTGNRRKVLFSDINVYKTKLEQERLDTLSELSALDQGMEMGY